MTWEFFAKYVDEVYAIADTAWIDAKGTTPVTGALQFNWGDHAGEGILSADWAGVANPVVLDLLQDIIPARLGPGVGPLKAAPPPLKATPPPPSPPRRTTPRPT